MSHLETLIAEYLEWQGYLIRRNVKVGRLSHGGWRMELDVVGYHPQQGHLVHYEPSIDAHPWAEREARYLKKFTAAREHIFTEIFPWLPEDTQVEQVAVLTTHPRGRDTIAGGGLLSIDEFVAQVRADIRQCGPMLRNAIPEQYPLLRTLQMSECGYSRVLAVGGASTEPTTEE